ncbi:primosomal replication protein N [Alcaligenaceae bacterium]|uniref:primosomal replication protein N n=1 Tax=Parapusillimonas sp. JC17 TaxID=3445768 RepID=UPI0015D12CE7|nr:primosomal replication protein N [Alcaligenaceae bacterium]
MNQLVLTATALEVQPLRYTPAGLPAVEMMLEHESEVQEAGHARRVEMVLSAIALGDIALLLADTPLGASLSIQGFLAPSRKGSSKLVLHIQQASRVFSGGASAVV